MTSEYSIPVREIPIATLGQAKIPSPLPYGNMINTGKVMLSLSHEYDEDIDTHQTLLFEEAGPRQDLYFDPGKTKCAIVTCGGLCPGLNDVIRPLSLKPTTPTTRLPFWASVTGSKVSSPPTATT